MSITKRTFLIVCSIISFILLTLNLAIYLLFRVGITQQIITSQEALIQANVQLSRYFTQAVDQLVYQYTSDEQLGHLLSRQTGQDELEDMNTRFSLNDRLFYQLITQSLLLNNDFSIELYLNPDLEVDGLFTSENTIPNVSRVFSGTEVEQQDWYQAVLKQRSGQYIFLSEDQTELCFACKLQNSFFAGPYQKAGLGVLRGSLPMDRLPQLLSLVPVTENSGFLLLSKEGEMVFRSQKLQELSMDGTLFLPNSVSSQQNIGGQEYLCSSQELQWGLQFVFLTPYQDINRQVLGLVAPYLICSVIFLAVGVLASLILSAGLSRPVVQFTRKIESIRGTRDLHWDSSQIKGPREIQQLNRSFGGLVQRINTLIDEVAAKERLYRETELRALQAQINPHFMLNAMNAVNYMALERDEDDIAATVNSIANMMRYSITEPERLVTMSTELENIQEYISVYVLRFGQDIRLQIEPGVPPDQVVLPKFTLQPLVENSIRHGITRQDPGITIYIRAAIQEDRMLVEVTDTGMGADAALLNDYLDHKPVQLKVTHGFGIRNVNERLQLQFGDSASLRYFNYEGNKLLARLTLPLQPPAADSVPGTLC